MAKMIVSEKQPEEVRASETAKKILVKKILNGKKENPPGKVLSTANTRKEGKKLTLFLTGLLASPFSAFAHAPHLHFYESDAFTMLLIILSIILVVALIFIPGTMKKKGKNPVLGAVAGIVLLFGVVILVKDSGIFSGNNYRERETYNENYDSNSQSNSAYLSTKQARINNEYDFRAYINNRIFYGTNNKRSFKFRNSENTWYTNSGIPFGTMQVTDYSFDGVSFTICSLYNNRLYRFAFEISTNMLYDAEGRKYRMR